MCRAEIRWPSSPSARTLAPGGLELTPESYRAVPRRQRLGPQRRNALRELLGRSDERLPVRLARRRRKAPRTPAPRRASITASRGRRGRRSLGDPAGERGQRADRDERLARAPARARARSRSRCAARCTSPGRCRRRSRRPRPIRRRVGRGLLDAGSSSRACAGRSPGAGLGGALGTSSGRPGTPPRSASASRCRSRNDARGRSRALHADLARVAAGVAQLDPRGDANAGRGPQRRSRRRITAGHSTNEIASGVR